MGKTSYSGNSGKTGKAGNYFGKPASGISMKSLWGYAEKMSEVPQYQVEQRKLRLYEESTLEKTAYSAIAAVDYNGTHRQLYSENIARGTERGYGMPVKGEGYGNIINFADYTRKTGYRMAA